MSSNGARYGRKIRKLAGDVDVLRKASYECLKCNKKKVKRRGYALWICKSCGATFAGGAYSFTTDFGRSTLRILESSSGE
ncbi:MAG: 50S ribosomal protein L37ae [Candidatus Micrarchaeia archaeon]